MLLPILVLSAAAGFGPIDDTRDNTQCRPSDVRLHPAEKTIIENLLRAGATLSVNRHGRLLYLYGARNAKLPKNILGLLDGTPALRGIAIDGMTDEMLAYLKGLRLPRFEMITLTRCPVTDRSLKLFRQFPAMNWVNLEETRITDRGLEYLSEVPGLLGLRLNRTAVTDAGLRALMKLKKLRHLELEDTAITDAGLKHLGQMGSLETLYLRGTKITDAGLAHLQSCKLSALALDRTAITDAGLAQFAKPGGLRNVKHLYLSRTNVTDAGIRHLDAIPHLQGVALDGTRATIASVRRLKKRPELYWITNP
jgi:Leucine Rich repeat